MLVSGTGPPATGRSLRRPTSLTKTLTPTRAHCRTDASTSSPTPTPATAFAIPSPLPPPRMAASSTRCGQSSAAQSWRDRTNPMAALNALLVRCAPRGYQAPTHPQLTCCAWRMPRLCAHRRPLQEPWAIVYGRPTLALHRWVAQLFCPHPVTHAHNNNRSPSLVRAAFGLGCDARPLHCSDEQQGGCLGRAHSA